MNFGIVLRKSYWITTFGSLLYYNLQYFWLTLNEKYKNLAFLLFNYATDFFPVFILSTIAY